MAGLMEGGEQVGFLVADRRFDGVLMVVDVEALVEGFVEQAADVGVGVAVEDVGVGNEVQGVPEDSRADGELF
ncbi:hypothetical protein [Nocardia sp. NPDC004123]